MPEAGHSGDAGTRAVPPPGLLKATVTMCSTRGWQWASFSVNSPHPQPLEFRRKETPTWTCRWKNTPGATGLWPPGILSNEGSPTAWFSYMGTSAQVLSGIGGSGDQRGLSKHKAGRVVCAPLLVTHDPCSSLPLCTVPTRSPSATMKKRGTPPSTRLGSSSQPLVSGGHCWVSLASPAASPLPSLYPVQQGVGEHRDAAQDP